MIKNKPLKATVALKKPHFGGLISSALVAPCGKQYSAAVGSSPSCGPRIRLRIPLGDTRAQELLESLLGSTNLSICSHCGRTTWTTQKGASSLALFHSLNTYLSGTAIVPIQKRDNKNKQFTGFKPLNSTEEDNPKKLPCWIRECPGCRYLHQRACQARSRA
jgi:hypothetical protein